MPLSLFIAAIASGFFALLGALGSQIINARANLKAKRMELAYGRKADAYKDFMVKAGTFGHDPWEEEKYLEFLHSYLAAQIFASEKVNEILTGKDGVHINAQRLRSNREYTAMASIQSSSWLNAMHAITKAMRDDLQNLSGH
jgi:hypothetical protein